MERWDDIAYDLRDIKDHILATIINVEIEDWDQALDSASTAMKRLITVWNDIHENQQKESSRKTAS